MTAANERLRAVKEARRIVVKIGSSVIARRDRGLDGERLDRLAASVAALRRAGAEVLVVSSGAVISGLEKLGLAERPKSLPIKQAAAAVGQSRLIWAYEKHFEAHGLRVAQVLLTHEDLDDRRRFLNSRNTLVTLLDFGVIPIINENDTVSVEEIRFGDNDTLAGMVSHLIDADLLVILSDVDGLHTTDPRHDPAAERIALVPRVTPAIERTAGSTGGPEGTGGMASKLRTAQRLAAYGIPTVVAAGGAPEVLERILRGDDVGTLFLAAGARGNHRKHWIAYTLKSKGRLLLDDGAVTALTVKHKSLLPSGVREVQGRFGAGDAVSCVDASGREVAKGLVNYGADAIAKLCGAKTGEIQDRIGYKDYDEIIHRDNLVILPERS